MTYTPSIGILKKQWHEDSLGGSAFFPFSDEVNMKPQAARFGHSWYCWLQNFGTHQTHPQSPRHRDMECPVDSPEGGQR